MGRGGTDAAVLHLRAASTDLVGVDPDRNAKGPRQAKVGQLDDPLVVDQEVLGLQVSVENAAAVAEVNALQDLVQVTLGAADTPTARQREDGSSGCNNSPTTELT